jgi:DNA primase
MTDLQAPDYVDMLPLPPAVRGRLLAHYEWVKDWIAASFSQTPLVAVYYPHGVDGDESYSGAWHQPLPSTVPHVEVHASGGLHLYPGCSANAIMWLVNKGAVGFRSWTPAIDRPDVVRYARLLLRPNPGADDVALRAALKHLRAVLQPFGIDGIPLLDGKGAALFIPFADKPAYDAVRTFLHTVVSRAAAASPDTIVPERKAHEPIVPRRIEITVRSNAPGRFSSLPYTLVGGPKLSMVTPVTWAELDRVRVSSDEAVIGGLLHRGDVFAQLAKPLAKQRFASIAAAVR